MIPVTPAQRCRLARLRINHPRAVITVPAEQHQRPEVRLLLRWRQHGKQRRRLNVWVHPDGTLRFDPVASEVQR